MVVEMAYFFFFLPLILNVFFKSLLFFFPMKMTFF